MPDFSVEISLGGTIAGIDEAGRGPLAGPVVAAAVVLDRASFPPDMTTQIDDCKKLPKPVREMLFRRIVAIAPHAIGQASVEEIDRLNILQASMLAMRRAFDNLPELPACALVDGNCDPGLRVPTRCLVGGDGRSLSIAAASIIAKVARDRIMADLDRQFPGYGWNTNAGYGTREHQRGLAEFGVTPHHRRSFAPVAKLLEA